MIMLLIKICLWLLAFTPLIVDDSVFFPYISGKNLYMQSFLVLAGLLFISYFFYSQRFRKEIVTRIKINLRNPLVISVVLFILSFSISTIFAVDKYSAFWGGLERGEGLVGMIFLFTFFIFTLLIFEKKDWIFFFRWSMGVGLILFARELIEYIGGVPRPGSYIGNPTFLAGYLLFIVSSSLIVFESTLKTSSVFHADLVKSLKLKTFWRYLSIITIILSFIGIFLTQTRGSILGLLLGIISCLIFVILKAKNITWGKISLRHISIIVICLIFFSSGIFILTRDNTVWQKFPGLSRIAIINTTNIDDVSTPIRLIVYKMSLKAVDPIQNDWKKTLIGWGPDNYILAYGKYYNPILYKYQSDWSDRSHNKIIDIVVMTGIIGLIIFLSIWLLYFKAVLSISGSIKENLNINKPNKNLSLVGMALLFFGVSYLVHLMFVFDQITTYITFFALLSFVTLLMGASSYKEEIGRLNIKKSSVIILSLLFITFIILQGYIYFASTVPAYLQMRKYTSLTLNFNLNRFANEQKQIFEPMNYAQTYIRRGAIKIMSDVYNNRRDSDTLKLLNEVFLRGEDYAKLTVYDTTFLISLADSLSTEGNIVKNIEYLKAGEEYYRKVLELAPDRQDANFGLAINLAYQQRFDEALLIIDRMIRLDNKVSDSYYKKGIILFLQGGENYVRALDKFEQSFSMGHAIISRDINLDTSVYTMFAKYFYETRNKEALIKVASRLKSDNYPGAVALEQIIDYLNTFGTWPSVNFN